LPEPPIEKDAQETMDRQIVISEESKEEYNADTLRSSFMDVNSSSRQFIERNQQENNVIEEDNWNSSEGLKNTKGRSTFSTLPYYERKQPKFNRRLKVLREFSSYLEKKDLCDRSTYSFENDQES
jgi:hypothetical protein